MQQIMTVCRRVSQGGIWPQSRTDRPHSKKRHIEINYSNCSNNKNKNVQQIDELPVSTRFKAIK